MRKGFAGVERQKYTFARLRIDFGELGFSLFSCGNVAVIGFHPPTILITTLEMVFPTGFPCL